MKLNLGTVNSPACEQAFKWINSFTNLKSMNESHFNLHIEGRVSTLANPLNENRDIELIANNIGKINLVEKIDMEPKRPKDNKKTDVFKKSEKLEDCFVLDKNGQLNCNYCDGKYQREGHMKNHLETKHNIIVTLICSCGQLFDDTTRYGRHKKSCKK